MLAYAYKDLIKLQMGLYFVTAMAAGLPAIFLGRLLNSRLKNGVFFKYVYIGLLLIGVLLIVLSEKDNGL